MKFLLSILLILSPALAFAQHDPTLDSINGGMANVDADINGYLSQQLTLNQLQTNSSFVYSNILSGSSAYNLTMGSNAASMQTNFTTWLSNFSNVFGSNSIPNMDYGSTNLVGFSNVNQIIIGPFWTNGGTFTLDMTIHSLTNITSVASFVPGFIVLIVWLIHFFALFEYMKAEIYQTMNQKQMAGSSQTIMGTNAAVLTGLIYCAAITASIASCLGLIATNSFIAGPGGVAAVYNGIVHVCGTVLAALPAWDVMTYMFPCTQLVAAWISYNVFRSFFIWPLFTTVRMLYFWLIK